VIQEDGLFSFTRFQQTVSSQGGQSMDRRDFFGVLAVAGLAGGSAEELQGQDVPDADVTRGLAHWIVTSKPDETPLAVRKEAARSLLNWVACAVGGSRQEALDMTLSAIAPFSGPRQATVLGRKERLDVLHAALVNGMSSHVFDFDDTHLRTIIHPAGPVAAAILALAEYKPVSGRDFLYALTVGIETECRIGNAVYPDHYDAGWHITGTVGVFGAAAAAGRILGLTEQQMRWAIGLAAVQPVGLREVFGTMTKSFHPGRAAQNGLMAALLASKNFNSSEQALEGKTGWASTLSPQRNYAEITDNLGKTWEAALNTYKPFPCGIPLHPSIDACIQLRNQHNLKPEQIEKIELGVHRLALELTGRKTPQTGADSKYSVYHAAAVAIIYGAAGEKQFSDSVVRDAATVALRQRVTAVVDSSVKEEQVRAAVILKDGRRLEKFIEDAVGSVRNPMTDAMLEAKFLDLAAGILPQAKARRLMDLCWKVETLSNAGDIARAGSA
jgi:2-methylcitrate dehydratase PrpD